MVLGRAEGREIDVGRLVGPEKVQVGWVSRKLDDQANEIVELRFHSHHQVWCLWKHRVDPLCEFQGGNLRKVGQQDLDENRMVLCLIQQGIEGTHEEKSKVRNNIGSCGDQMVVFGTETLLENPGVADRRGMARVLLNIVLMDLVIRFIKHRTMGNIIRVRRAESRNGDHGLPLMSRLLVHVILIVVSMEDRRSKRVIDKRSWKLDRVYQMGLVATLGGGIDKGKSLSEALDGSGNRIRIETAGNGRRQGHKDITHRGCRIGEGSAHETVGQDGVLVTRFRDWWTRSNRGWLILEGDRLKELIDLGNMGADQSVLILGPLVKILNRTAVQISKQALRFRLQWVSQREIKSNVGRKGETTRGWKGSTKVVSDGFILDRLEKRLTIVVVKLVADTNEPISGRTAKQRDKTGELRIVDVQIRWNVVVRRKEEDSREVTKMSLRRFDTRVSRDRWEIKGRAVLRLDRIGDGILVGENRIIRSISRAGIGNKVTRDILVVHLDDQRRLKIIAKVANEVGGGRWIRIRHQGSSRANACSRVLVNKDKPSHFRLLGDKDGTVGWGRAEPLLGDMVRGVGGGQGNHRKGITVSSTGLAADIGGKVLVEETAMEVGNDSQGHGGDRNREYKGEGTSYSSRLSIKSEKKVGKSDFGNGKERGRER